ncbi:MAG: SIR2 family protein [Solirubrobacterales bacterium]
MPNGPDLGRELLQTFDIDPEDAALSLAAAVDRLVRQGVEEERMLLALAASLAARAPHSSPLIEALIRVPSRFIVTLNFDLSIEAAASAQGSMPVTLGNGRRDLQRALGLLSSNSPPNELTVLHLHGHVEEPEQIVLGGEGYARISSGLSEKILYELAVRRVLAFYGTTLDEPYFLTRLQEITNRGSHVLWCRESDRLELTGGRNPILPSRSDIYIGTVRHFEDLPATLGPVLGGELPPASRVRPAGLAHPDPLYVQNDLSDRRRPNDPQDLALVSFGLEPKREVMPDPGEEDVLDGLRTIILGEPGSGKSELLRALASRTKAPRVGLFIRLAELDLDSGLGPRETLAAWAKKGLASRRGVDVSPSAIESGRYHFFLDGLDEVDSALHEDFARVINKVAGESPQHAFTLSTRPLPSLELLSIESTVARDWSQFALTPGTEWRDRYLARRGVSLEELEAEMPALADMAEVLVTPFYLRHVIDLHEQGQLGGQRDSGDLLATLLDSAISREEGSVELDNDAVRIWLRDVALAATIAGTRTLSESDLLRISSPGGGEVDPVKLARALEHRLLMAEDAGSFRFPHRLLGEQLAAEALVSAGPHPALRDCLVPYVDGRLSGVRPDAAVTLGLACLRSREWRVAVAERDLGVAARATPRDATVRERSDALRALWDKAIAAQIWVWDRGTGLTDDAEAMVRLVRGLPNGRVAREMRKAIDSGTSQDQGNAIRILSRALPQGLEAKLRKVLRDPERNGVVLRQAALAASECGFTDLVDDIVEMLLGQSEGVIHQDAIISLKRLMGDRPQLEVYQRLMGGPEAGYVLAIVLDDLDPADALRLLAAYVRESSESPGALRRDRAPEILAAVPSEELKGEVLQAGVEVGVVLGFGREHLIRLREADRAAALAGMARVIAENDLSWYEALGFTLLFEVDELRHAGIPEEFIERVEQRRRVEAETAKLEAEGTMPVVPDEPEEEEEGGREPTLGELLDDRRSDVMILNNSRYFAPQVGDLSPPQLRELRRRLARWWPKKPFAETITRTNSNSWRQEGGAAAWVWLGPAARPSLSARQWGELATCGILFSNQSDWLKETQSLEGVYEAITAIGSDGDPERWAQLLGACEDPLPNLLFERCAESLDPEAAADPSTVTYRMASIAKRFVTAGREDLARRLAGRSEEFSKTLPPILAEHGHLEAQREMFEELKRTLDEDNLPDDHRLSWMNGVTETVMLPELFEVLRRSYKLSDRPRPRVMSGFDLHDIVNPTTETISRIGGRGAVAGYDRLIDAGGDFRWLGAQRERVAAQVLSEDGERFAAEASERLQLPNLTDRP